VLRDVLNDPEEDPRRDTTTHRWQLQIIFEVCSLSLCYLILVTHNLHSMEFMCGVKRRLILFVLGLLFIASLLHFPHKDM